MRTERGKANAEAVTMGKDGKRQRETKEAWAYRNWKGVSREKQGRH